MDEALQAEISIRGCFAVGTERWSNRQLEQATEIDTADGECRAEDKPMLIERIQSHPADQEGLIGFERLNKVVFEFRSKMKDDLTLMLEEVQRDIAHAKKVISLHMSHIGDTDILM